MGFLTTAVLDWFDDGCCDVQFLDLWSHTPITYTPNQAAGPEWQADNYETILAKDNDGRIFQKAADLLMRYRFYPGNIISGYGDFDLGKGRRLRVGDRIIQRIHLLPLFGRSLLDVIGVTEISQVVDQPRSAGFTYVTAVPHVAQGRWSALLTWLDNGDLLLTIDALSRLSPQEPQRHLSFMRALQKKAHQRGIAHFRQLIAA
jgi:hypothetical protein